VFIPLVLAMHGLAREAETVIRWVAELRETGIAVPHWVAELPIAGGQIAAWWKANLADPQAARLWFQGFNPESFAQLTTGYGGQLLHRMFMFFVALIALFALLRHGQWLSRHTLESADRVLGDPGERLASKMVDAARGTVNGTVVVAIAEGLLIGTGYFLAGVPNPLLLTLLTAAFAMIPFGAWIAFTAAAFLLVINDGDTRWAAAVFGWGAVVMFIGDHFIWPKLVGNAA
jgi:predicted PurR-regulated permease PerM